jgi:hypothetical protein
VRQPLRAPRSPRALAALALAAPVLAAPAAAGAQGGYRQPPAPIARILDADPLPAVAVSPDRRWLVQLRRRGLPPMSEVGAPELRLAGLRINPRTNGGTRDVSYTGLAFQPVDGGAVRPVTLAGLAGEPRIGSPIWAPGGRRLAFTVTGPTGITLWAADAPAATSTGPIAARRVAAASLNAVAGPPCAWVDAERLACLTVPAGRGAPPAASPIPTGPIEQESEGKAAPNPTFQDLLKSPADETLFDHYATAQVALVGLDGRVTPVGAPAVRSRVAPSPTAGGCSSRRCGGRTRIWCPSTASRAVPRCGRSTGGWLAWSTRARSTSRPRAASTRCRPDRAA